MSLWILAKYILIKKESLMCILITHFIFIIHESMHYAINVWIQIFIKVDTVKFFCEFESSRCCEPLNLHTNSCGYLQEGRTVHVNICCDAYIVSMYGWIFILWFPVWEENFGRIKKRTRKKKKKTSKVQSCNVINRSWIWTFLHK